MSLYHLLDPFWQRLPWPSTVNAETDEMVPGVLRLRLARTFLGREIMPVHCYVVGDTLVDTGMPAAEPEVLAAAREHGVSRVVLTHHHEDHAGNAAALRAAGFEVVASPLTARLLAEDMPLPFYQHMAWGRTRPAEVGTFGDTVMIGTYEAQVIPAPGHAVDQVALYVSERGWLFAGDVFIHERVKLFRGDEDFDATLGTLGRIAALDFEVLFCGHRPLAEGGREAIARKLDWLRGLAEKARYHHAAGQSVGEIVRRIGIRSSGWFVLLSVGDASPANLVRAIVEGPRPRPEVRRAVEAFRKS